MITVAELIKVLQTFHPDLPVAHLYNDEPVHIHAENIRTMISEDHDGYCQDLDGVVGVYLQLT